MSKNTSGKTPENKKESMKRYWEKSKKLPAGERYARQSQLGGGEIATDKFLSGKATQKWKGKGK